MKTLAIATLLVVLGLGGMLTGVVLGYCLVGGEIVPPLAGVVCGMMGLVAAGSVS